MASEQREKAYAARLGQLSEEQLRAVLNEELQAEEPDDLYIREIAALLAEKGGEEPADGEKAYRDFMDRFADTEQLYGEVEKKLEAENEMQKKAGKVLSFRRLARVGIVAAILIALLATGSIVAGALGFQIGNAKVSWNEDTMAVSGEIMTPVDHRDPFFALRTALAHDGYEGNLVPHYLPEGFQLIDYERLEPYGDGRFFYHAVYRSDDLIMQVNCEVRNPNSSVFYPKDEGEPEIYTKNGVDHFITTNEGRYLAIWGSGDLSCEILGVDSREELIKMIDSIYEESTAP